MRAITLWQPWATYVAMGAKKIETRHWPTNMRGEIAIHAAKRKPDAGPAMDIQGEVPLGAVVATVEIIDCVPIEALYGTAYDTREERAVGDWSPGRYGWILANPVPLDPPVPARGRQGVWRWEKPPRPVAEGAFPHTRRV